MYDSSLRKSSKTKISAATFCKVGLRPALFVPLLLLQSCGYVGDIMPPALNLPAKATDVTVQQHAGNLVVGFVMPRMTTEGILIRRPPETDLRIGPAPADLNDINGWAAHATRIPVPNPGHVEIPVAPWVNQTVALSVRILNDRGKDAGWTPLLKLTVVPPLPQPATVVAESAPTGVHLKWTSSAPKFRVLRRDPDNPNFTQVATPGKPEYTDEVPFGKEYAYAVQALTPAGDATAESDLSVPAIITPKDVFPPAAPTGLDFILGGKTIELTWTRNTEPDLAGYRVYRAFENNPFDRIKETQDSNSYSDRNIEPGKHYRYAVTAIDRAGNESPQSTPITVTAP